MPRRSYSGDRRGEMSRWRRRSTGDGRSDSRKTRGHRHQEDRVPLKRRRSASRSFDDNEEPYVLELLKGRHEEPLPMCKIAVDDGDGERLVPHVCAQPSKGYVIRVTNDSRKHIACRVTVDGENTLLRDGSLIVAPDDARELPGFLVSKNFIGKEYVKEYRDFMFGKPRVVENCGNNVQVEDDVSYTTYGRIVCEVFEAVLDEEVESDQEVRGQTTFYRGAGLHGSYDERIVPEGKKKHLLYSSVTVQGARSSIANSTRGRWWVRGTQKLRTLEVRYREAHSLMLLGVDAKVLGLPSCKEEDSAIYVKKERLGPAEGLKKEEDLDEKDNKIGIASWLASGLVEVCDLTVDEDVGNAVWTTREGLQHAEPVNVDVAP